jgi:hypothetical protein
MMGAREQTFNRLKKVAQKADDQPQTALLTSVAAVAADGL